jgi:hypothetical protein
VSGVKWAIARGEEKEMTKSSEAGAPTGAESAGAKVEQQGSQVATSTAQAGKHLAHTATEQGGQVAREAGRTARSLVDQAQTELRDQACMQQKRAAEGLRMLGDQLRAMTDKSGQPGMAADLVGDASDRAHRAAEWLEHREPGQVVEEVRNLARRRPGAFLVGAALAGVLAGRLTRNLGQSNGQGGEPGAGPAPSGEPGASPAPAPGGQPQPTPPATAAAPASTGGPAPTPASSVSPEVQP